MAADASTAPASGFKRFLRLGPAVWLATGGGIGFVPWAPGTFGSLWGVALTYGLLQLPTVAAVSVWAAICLLGVPVCSAAAARLRAKDPGAVVWDEIVALPVTFLFVDLQQSPAMLAWMLAIGFLLFRFFDVVKPPPARSLERLPGGFGIMADDLAAGAYACLAMHAVKWCGVV